MSIIETWILVGHFEGQLIEKKYSAETDEPAVIMEELLED
jgi:hypothetical protein